MSVLDFYLDRALSEVLKRISNVNYAHNLKRKVYVVKTYAQNINFKFRPNQFFISAVLTEFHNDPQITVIVKALDRICGGQFVDLKKNF